MGSSLQPTDSNQKQEAFLRAPTEGQEWKRSSFHLRLPSGLSPQIGQGQVPSPHDNRPHSHMCNRRALLGGLCHPPHIPLSGTCRLWRGPGDLSAPSRGWGGRGVDGGIRAERRFSLDPRVWQLLAQRSLRVTGTRVFLSRRARDMVDHQRPKMRRDAPKMGLVGRNDKLKEERRMPEGWTQSKRSMEIMVDKGIQKTIKEMDGKTERRENVTALNRK